MFLASNICWVSSGTVTARYCWLPRAVRGAKEVMKKWRRGKGTAQQRSQNQARKRNTSTLTHVDSQLPEVRVELTREAQAGGDAGHDEGDEMVQVTVRRRGELESAEADVVESLVIDTEGLVRVLNQLVDGEGGVVGLEYSPKKMSI